MQDIRAGRTGPQDNPLMKRLHTHTRTQVSPTFSPLWSDPSLALCPGSFAGWRGCRPVWIPVRFWCKGPAWRRTVRSRRCRGSPAPRARSPPRSPCGRNPLWWGRTSQWTSRWQTAQLGRTCRPLRCPGPPLYTRASLLRSSRQVSLPARHGSQNQASPRGSRSPSVSHFPRLVNNKVLLAACSAMAEHKDTVLQDGFHGRTPPMQASRLWYAHPRTATVRNVHRGGCKHGPAVLGVQVFICLTHPSLCFISKTTKLLHGGRWETLGSLLQPRAGAVFQAGGRFRTAARGPSVPTLH